MKYTWKITIDDTFNSVTYTIKEDKGTESIARLLRAISDKLQPCIVEEGEFKRTYNETTN